MPRSYLLLIYAVILVLVSGGIGFVFGYRTTAKNFPFANLATTGKTSSQIVNDSIFTSQIAIIRGKVTAANSITLTIVNSNNITGQFPLSKKFTVIKQPTGASAASASADFKTVQLNQLALIQLEMVGGVYQVVTVSYLTPPPPAPPTLPSSNK